MDLRDQDVLGFFEMYAEASTFFVFAGFVFGILAYFSARKQERRINPTFAMPTAVLATIVAILMFFFGLGLVWWPELLFKVGSWLP